MVIYIDDAGDEPAFATLGSDGISMIVGRRNRTRARLFVRHPGEVQRLLRLLAQLLEGITRRTFACEDFETDRARVRSPEGQNPTAGP